jgi:hypothetical protein
MSLFNQLPQVPVVRNARRGIKRGLADLHVVS